MELKVLLLVLLVGCGIELCTAWGADGHEMVCTIAQSFFSRATAEAVSELLQPYYRGESDYAGLCPWADWVAWGDRGAPYYRWSKDLHYADSPCSEQTCAGGTGGGGNCGWHYKANCPCRKGGSGDGECVVGAINNYTRQLTAFTSLASSYSKISSFPRPLGPLSDLPVLNRKPGYNLTEALLFVSHFVGDSHQPLHCGFKSDLGGNRIKTKCDFCGVRGPKHENLHAVWDDGIIEHAIRKVYMDKDAMVAALKERLSDGGEYAEQKKQWINCGDQAECSLAYTDESQKLACGKAYQDEHGVAVVSGAELDVGYYTSRLPIVEMRLAQAGVRLAHRLNTVFGSKASALPV